MRQDPFHEGEIRAQNLASEHERALRVGRSIGPSIPRAALDFVEQQSYAVVATEDARGAPWVSMIFGAAGFATAEPQSLVLSLDQMFVASKDPLLSNLEGSSRIGFLFIELATRRRLRINGSVRLRSSSELHIDVAQAYSNCPKYIQRRHLLGVDAPSGEAATAFRTGTRLSSSEAAVIEAADTLFVASLHPSHGLDASHRGGHAGFVQVDVGKGELHIPDYPGNSMFNTFGNLLVEPRVGLMVPDFERGRALHLVGRSTIEWNADDEHSDRSGGTGRMWLVAVDRWLELPLAATTEWSFVDASPFNPPV